MSNWKKILITAVVCLSGGLLAGLLLRGCGNNNPPEPIVIHDSISVHDTTYIYKHTTPKEIVKWDTCYLPITDSIHDTISVQVPIMAYEYLDTFKTDTSSIELGVHFSGYKAKIDSIDLQYRFEVEPRMIEKKHDWRWAVTPSVQVGYGASIVGQQVYAAPYVGVGISVGFGYTWKK